MLKKPFYTAYAAVFIVFSSLLVGLGLSVYASERARPGIYNCFVYRGDFDSLQTRLEVESKYIDHFVVVQALDKNKLSDKERQQLLKDYPEQLTCITVPTLESSSLKDCYLKGLQNCENSDIVLLSEGNQIIDSKKLYQSLKAIAADPEKIFTLQVLDRHLKHSEVLVSAITYQTLKIKSQDSLRSPVSLKEFKEKKRRLFFQTIHSNSNL